MTDNQELIKELCKSGAETFMAGELLKAKESFEKVISLIPEHFQSLYYLGTILKLQGNYKEAIEKFNLVQLQEESAEIYENIGICHFHSGEFEQAEYYFKRAVLKNADYGNVYANLASVLQIMGKYEQAISNYRKYLILNPDNPEIYNNIGLALEAESKYSEAEKNFRKAITFNKVKTNFFYNLAMNLQFQQKYEESLKYFNEAIELNPVDPDFYNNLAISYQFLNNYVKASENYEKAINIFPGNPDFFNNLGSVLEAQSRYSEAIINYKKAVQLSPESEKFYYNLAVSQEKTANYSQAINNYIRAIRLKPDYADAHWNLSLLLLLQGEYTKGWREYEWRFLAASSEKIISAKPKWDGTNLSGKTICIKHEQGLGDAIQFCRYLPMLKEKGCKVIFETPAGLRKLFEGIKGYDVLLSKNGDQPGNPDKLLNVYDFYLPLMSLPLLFETTVSSIPASIPYIKSVLPTAGQLEKLKKIRGIKIGIVWEGNPLNINNQRRSCPLTFFYELAVRLNIKFFSLQKGNATFQQQKLPSHDRIIDLSGDLKNFSDTAAVINNLDLVISVDTAVAHLTGALGKPVWTLLHFTPDWRWLLNSNDSPWYPTMELFRQPAPDDWDSVFNDLEKRLREW